MFSLQVFFFCKELRFFLQRVLFFFASFFRKVCVFFLALFLWEESLFFLKKFGFLFPRGLI